MSGWMGMQESAASKLKSAICAHDSAVDKIGRTIWIGAEPTFTLARSESPEWLYEALGGDKQAYALHMIGALRQRHSGYLVLRTVGRQYAGEDSPRWSYGLYHRRDGKPVWTGPVDPLADPPGNVAAPDLSAFAASLKGCCRAVGWQCETLHVADRVEHRLLLWHGDDPVAAIAPDDPRLLRPSVHTHKSPADGLTDSLAGEGLFLITIGALPIDAESSVACIEMPAFNDVAAFLEFVSATERAATDSGIAHLVFRGFPPPVDESIAWTSFTPDPAVIEVNMAPQPNVAQFDRAAAELYAVAAQLGLSPYRLQYNGDVGDSGGGGQFTLGGATPMQSPFLVHPELLPRLVRYVNHHPALSYWFATVYIGAASQSPRTDEGTRDSFRELAVALDQLGYQPEASDPETLWASLAPFLADPSGNAHRSELNIEKLWNPHLPGRGRLGLVEFRAFRMPETPQRATAIAALLRAVAAMLTISDPADALQDWGDALHDRFALPHFLVRDLHEVFADLRTQGFGLDPLLENVLTEIPAGSRWSTRFAGCELAIERALEFWPLVGDVASQESGGSRLVDSSTLRLQISLRPLDDAGIDLQQWRMRMGDFELPLRDVQDDQGALRLVGVRYRDFAPWRGLHPNIPAQMPLVFTLLHPAVPDALELTLHNWQPQGQPYTGLPETLEQADSRRLERFVTRPRPVATLPAVRQPPAGALAGHTFDYRICQTIGPAR